MNRQSKKDIKQLRQLITQLESESAKERAEAVVAIGKLQNTAALPALNKIATLDPNPKVRQIAHQAVKFLMVIKKQEEEVARRARIEALDEEDEEGSGWDDFADDILGDSTPSKPTEDEPWNYLQQLESRKDEVRDKTPVADEDGSRKRWRRRRRLYLVILIAILGLGVVAYVRLNETDEPKSREEALERLSEWFDQVAATTNAYSAALISNQVDCTAFRSQEVYVIPTQPEWAGTDKAYQEGLNDFFDNMKIVEETLKETRRRVENLCGTSDGVREWPTASINPKSLIDDAIREHIIPAADNLNIAKSALDN